jgi:hypothetical protein
VKELRPGLHPQRLTALMRAALDRTCLDLSGSVILTEAATGAYVVTPVLAAMAGARAVYAVTRSTSYGTFEEVSAETIGLARLVGVGDRIKILADMSRDLVSQVDIVTNSGHVRPISREVVSWMKPTAVIPLMYEAWELRNEDVDLAACRERGVLVAGTNERHPALDIFPFLGTIALKLLMDAGVAVCGTSILMLCDNPFACFLERGLIAAGARVETRESLSSVPPGRRYDALLVALKPRPEPVLSAAQANSIATEWPGAVVAQFWGDLDRPSLRAADVPFWPVNAPAPGHMGVLLSDIGPEPVVRLQAGGLKVGEVLWRSRKHGFPATLASQGSEDTRWEQALEP